MADYTVDGLSSTVGRGQLRSPTITIDTAIENKTATQVDNLFEVYEGDIVLRVTAEVVTAEGGVLTFDVGDGTDPNGYLAAADANVAGWKIPAGTEAYSTIAFNQYSAEDTIDVTWSAIADAAKVRFTAYILGA